MREGRFGSCYLRWFRGAVRWVGAEERGEGAVGIGVYDEGELLGGGGLCATQMRRTVGGVSGGVGEVVEARMEMWIG